MVRSLLFAVTTVALLVAGCDCHSPSNTSSRDTSRAEAQQPATQSAKSRPSHAPAGPASRPTAVGTSSGQPTGDPASDAGPAGVHDKLYGTWVSKDVPTSAGDVKIRLTFREEGPVRIVAWSELPFVGKVRETKGPYEVHGNTITSSAIHGGTSVQYWFDQGDLVIRYDDGKTVRFQRQ